METEDPVIADHALCVEQGILQIHEVVYRENQTGMHNAHAQIAEEIGVVEDHVVLASVVVFGRQQKHGFMHNDPAGLLIINLRVVSCS